MAGGVQWDQAAFVQRVRQATMRGIARWITRVDKRSVELILQTSKSGRVYKRRSVTHRASAGGEPPASDTGTLVNSRNVSLDDNTLSARLTYATKYARALQLGTEKMEPRPWLDRAVADTREAGLGDVREELAAVLR